jgi:hypothetical protein
MSIAKSKIERLLVHSLSQWEMDADFAKIAHELFVEKNLEERTP